jgi:hypothetical protein
VCEGVGGAAQGGGFASNALAGITFAGLGSRVECLGSRV